MGYANFELRQVQAAYEQLADCDLIHDHTTLGPVWHEAARLTIPVVTTVHCAFTPTNRALYGAFARWAAVVCISAEPARVGPGDPGGGSDPPRSGHRSITPWGAATAATR